jgi:hypothetical protein
VLLFAMAVIWIGPELGLVPVFLGDSRAGLGRELNCSETDDAIFRRLLPGAWFGWSWLAELLTAFMALWHRACTSYCLIYEIS